MHVNQMDPLDMASTAEMGATGSKSNTGPIPTLSIHEQLDSEKIHILLTYLSLLALSRHPTRPVIELNMKTQLLQLDAFLSGNITEDGEATHWVPESDTMERQQRYVDLCSQIVPNLTAAIRQQSSANLVAEPKNQVQGGNNPENKMFWRIVLAPKVVETFGEWVAESKKRDTSFNPDFDPWVDPTTNKKLIRILNSIVDLQYDFVSWNHSPPEPSFNQLRLPEGIEFQRVMSDPSLIRTYYRLVTPSGKVFSQTTIIPETSIIYTEQEAREMWLAKSRPKYLIPDPLHVTVPGRRKGQTWTNADGRGKTWTRGDEIFTLKILFFVFDQQTNAYINHHAVDAELADNIDLNNEAWVTAYRKKVAQWRSRATREATKVRDHWRDEEKIAIYAWANAYCREHGIDALLIRRLQIGKDMLSAVNSTVPGTRSVESVSAWARRQMNFRPNSPLGRLAAEQKRVADLVGAGVSVPDAERYPDEFIDMSAFAVQAGKSVEKNDDDEEQKSGEKASKSNEGIMDDPTSYDAGGSQNYSRDAIFAPSPQDTRKKIKVTYKGKGKQRAESPFEYESEAEESVAQEAPESGNLE